MSTGEASRSLTPKGVSTRARLVEAASAVFHRIPFGKAKITDITSEANVASGTFYTYFESKEEVFREVAADVLSRLATAPARDPDNTDHDPVQDIAHASRRFFETCLEHRRVLRSIEHLNSTDEAVSSTRHDALVRSAKRSERWIVRLQEAGICDPTLQPWYTAVALQAMNVSMGYDHLVLRDEPADIDELVSTVTRVWAKTVGLDPAPSQVTRR